MKVVMRYVILYGLASLSSLVTSSLALGSVYYSLHYHQRHVCNAISIGLGFCLVPAVCMSSNDPAIRTEYTVDRQIQGSHDTRMLKEQCHVTRFKAHPKHVLLHHNVAVMQVKCPTLLAKSVDQGVPIRDITGGDQLILTGLDASQRQVTTRVKILQCSVCEKEYTMFDCKRNMCLKLAGKIHSKLYTLDGLQGAGIFTHNGDLVGCLSYGFANGTFVVERASYYAQFLNATMREWNSNSHK